MNAKIDRILKPSGYEDWVITVDYDDSLDLVGYFKKQNTFFEIFDIVLHNLGPTNHVHLVTDFKLEVPEISFIKYHLNISPVERINVIHSTSIDGLERELELAVLRNLSDWNKNFVGFCLINLFPDLNESINFRGLATYYLNNSLSNIDYFPEDLNNLFSVKKTKIGLLEEILNSLKVLHEYEFPKKIFNEKFNLSQPVETFISKVTGDYKIELNKYNALKKEFDYKKQIFDQNELSRISNLQVINNDFSKDYIEIINEKVDSLYSIFSHNFHDDISCGLKLKNLIDSNIINGYYNFKYDLLYINDYLIIDFDLPSFNKFLEEKTIKKGNKEIESEFKSISISIIFGLSNLVFKNNSDCQINQIFFNCFLNFIDKSIGKNKKMCFISVCVSTEEFEEMDLNYIDLNQAFKRVKGISAPNITENISIRPIKSINTDDKRFVESKDIIQFVDEKTNLALMDWEDFEHFIRELFEKEFSSSGGEVRITQSSRDGGIDAVAFDPDPIKGGKIVIQSKRYTNVVGVSAVRDLYGTMINEGANKGILVTTSHFGSDAYKFSKDKPLTLIDGNNLLELLRKHNFHAKIDLEEAKRLNRHQE
jgi:restriction system protein